MADRHLKRFLTPPAEAFLGFFDLAEPFEIPDVDENGRAVIDVRGFIGGFGMDVDDMVPKLRELDATTLEVHIDSGGGNVWDGVSLFNALLSHPARIEIEVDAMAASAASVIAMAGDQITMHPGSMMMVHNARGFVDGGTSVEMRAVAELLDKVNTNLADIYSARAGGAQAAWLSIMSDETWFTGDEAVAIGLADQALALQLTPDEPEDTTTAEADAGGARDAVTDLEKLTDAFGYRYHGRDEAPSPDLAMAKVNGPTPDTLAFFDLINVDPPAISDEQLDAFAALFDPSSPDPATLADLFS